MTSENKSPALEVRALSAGYGRFDVVHDISLRVDKGEAVALLGPNGAGKTTVLRAIMGLVKRRRGAIRVGDTDVSKLPAYRIGRGLAAIAPEGRRLFLDQSVEDNLILGALHLRREKKRVQALLDLSTRCSRSSKNIVCGDRRFSAAASSKWSPSGACS